MPEQTRILVVEDNALNRVLVHDILEYRGHEVALATSVDEALGHLAEARPDLVLLDIQIPGGGGEVVLRAIRGDPGLSSTPVIALTAFAMAGDRERLLQGGFDGYISKPIDTRTFGAEVERHVAARVQPT